MHTMAEPPGIVSLRIDPVTGRSAAPGTPAPISRCSRTRDTPPSVNELPPGSFLAARCRIDEGAPIDPVLNRRLRFVDDDGARGAGKKPRQGGVSLSGGSISR